MVDEVDAPSLVVDVGAPSLVVDDVGNVVDVADSPSLVVAGAGSEDVPGSAEVPVIPFGN